MATVPGGLLTQGPARAPAGAIIEKMGFLKVSTGPSRPETFGWNVVTLYFATHSGKVIQ